MNFNLQLYGGRGGSSGGGGGGGKDFDADGYAITQRGYNQLRQKNQEIIDDWLKGRKPSTLEIEGYIFERYTMKSMKEVIQEVTQYGSVSDDEGIGIVYKNGKSEYFSSGDDFDYNSIKWSNVSTIYWSNEGTTAYAGSAKSITITPFNDTFKDYQRYGDFDYRMDF